MTVLAAIIILFIIVTVFLMPPDKTSLSYRLGKGVGDKIKDLAEKK